jgi:murein DD-endopeptidase MepM/ murein hydrolase activator NlpD
MRGETAYSIARLYNVNVKALADWNGLGPDLSVREGQTLMIPVATGTPVSQQVVTAPGTGSPTPTPPSAAKPLPAEKTQPTAEPVKTPPAPDLGAQKTAASGTARLAMPVSGKIIRGYAKKKNEGIDIAASAGTGVKAAGDGTVAAITKDTDQVPILVIRHEGNLLTVYANIDGIAVAKGDRVKRGQTIAKVRSADPAFLHFEVRQGFDSVDPVPYLQ